MIFDIIIINQIMICEFSDCKLSNKVLNKIKFILNKMCNSNTDIKYNNIFTSNVVPNMTIDEYIDRIIKYFDCGDSFIIYALIYVDRFCNIMSFDVTIQNVYKMLITCCVIACKYNEDDHYSNEYYARIGGISLNEMNTLELNMLISIKYDLHINKSVYDDYLSTFI